MENEQVYEPQKRGFTTKAVLTAAVATVVALVVFTASALPANDDAPLDATGANPPESSEAFDAFEQGRTGVERAVRSKKIVAEFAEAARAQQERRAIEYAVALEAAQAEEERLAAEQREREAAAQRAAEQTPPPAPPAPTGGDTPPPPAVATGSVWDALAQCESNGNWAMNSGNGFYGGLQFMHSTWLNMGGAQHAYYPHEATREQQIEVATRLQAQYGWGQWPACSARLGLR